MKGKYSWFPIGNILLIQVNMFINTETLITKLDVISVSNSLFQTNFSFTNVSSSPCGHTESSCGAVRSPLTRKSFNVSNPKSYAPLPTPLGMSPPSNCIPTLVYHSCQRRSTDLPFSTTAGWLDIATPWLLPCLRPPTLPGG